VRPLPDTSGRNGVILPARDRFGKPVSVIKAGAAAKADKENFLVMKIGSE
jgi:hypothetical protein